VNETIASLSREIEDRNDLLRRITRRVAVMSFARVVPDEVSELTEDDVRAFARQSLDTTLGYAHEYGEQRVQELQDYRAELVQQQAQGMQQAGHIVQQVHRQKCGLLNAQQSLQPTLESAG
jgi:ABC-type methionine transport system ATPase subunit